MSRYSDSQQAALAEARISISPPKEAHLSSNTGLPTVIVQIPPVEELEGRNTQGAEPARQVTIEDFLRWSVKTPPRTYKKRKHKHVDICVVPKPINHNTPSPNGTWPSDNEPLPRKRRLVRRVNSEDTPDGAAYTPSNHDDAFGEAESPSPKKRKQSGKRKKIKPSMTRLRAAALRSYVELPEDPNDAHTSSLRPLDLVPVSPGLVCSPEHKKWRYVDPRKTSRYPDVLEATSWKACNSPSARKQYKCISSWTPQIVSIASSSQTRDLPMSRAAQKQRRPPVETACQDTRFNMTPLDFVPLEEHERLLTER